MPEFERAMPEEPNITLAEVARQYLGTLDGKQRAANQNEVERFIRWYGADRPSAKLTGQEVANYAEMLAGGLTDATRRADAVRAFLAFAKKADFTSTNLGTHLRVRKASGSRKVTSTQVAKDVEMSQTEYDVLTAELDSLKAQRPKILLDIQRARADKDFRENAPLDAARQQQSHVEGRIRAIEGRLVRAVIVHDQRPTEGEAVDIGHTVVLRNVESGAELRYTLVRPGEVNLADGRISFESPVGRALMQRQPGEEVEVFAPSGTLRLRIERVEA